MTEYVFKRRIFLGILAVGLVIAALLATRITFAENSAVDPEPVKVKSEYKVETKSENRAMYESSKVGLSVNPSGNVQFGGAKFVSLSGSNLSITIYGLPLTLVANSNTQLVGVASLSDIKAGDVLSGKGQVDEASGTITALHIRDESQTSSRIAELEKQIQSLLEQLKRLQAEVKNTR